jgi:Cu-Zn family superoxide dismutase
LLVGTWISLPWKAGRLESDMSNLRKNRILTLCAVGAAAIVAGTGAAVALAVRADDAATDRAIAVLSSTQGQKAHGEVVFSRKDGGIEVVARIEGLTPGTHGFHVHEVGDCSAPDASSAKGHFNPGGQPHGARDASQRHEGDLGNVEADASGKAEAKLVDKQLALDGPQSIVGKAVIVHEKADDFTTQPTGNAGARVACGVVKAAPKER